MRNLTAQNAVTPRPLACYNKDGPGAGRPAVLNEGEQALTRGVLAKAMEIKAGRHRLATKIKPPPAIGFDGFEGTPGGSLS